MLLGLFRLFFLLLDFFFATASISSTASPNFKFFSLFHVKTQSQTFHGFNKKGFFIHKYPKPCRVWDFLHFWYFGVFRFFFVFGF